MSAETQKQFIALALMRAYVDASDEDLRDWSVSRADILRLARHYIDPHHDERLAATAEQIIVGFVAGRNAPPKE